jgi:hypothetical protein
MVAVVNLYKDQYDVYIGRAGKGRDGYFGNDHPVGKPCSRCRVTHVQGEAVDAYERDFNDMLENKIGFKARLHQLLDQVPEGQELRLGCFCKPKRCHGDVIATYLNKILEGK